MKFSATDYKTFYAPKQQPALLWIPTMKFITIHGTGDPNELGFQVDTEALYTFAYAIKMSYKKPNPPEGYYEYKVFPLEGIWDLVDKSIDSTVKSNYAYTLMIQQPDFVTIDVFNRFKESLLATKTNLRLKDVEYQELEEGLCCQMLHLGSYDDEPQTFKQMEEMCLSLGHPRSSKFHHEIYLSDPRRTEDSKLKTILRFSVKEG